MYPGSTKGGVGMMTLEHLVFTLFKGNLKKYRVFVGCNILTIGILFSLRLLLDNPYLSDPSIVDPLISSNVFAPALAFAEADEIVVAAPYWDMSFPSVLKVWVENMYVRNLTFRYDNDQSVGLCRGRESVYITTAGSPIGENDWGTAYMRAVLNTLGIPGFTRISAEALDLASSNPEAIMAAATDEVRRAARALVEKLSDGQ